MGRDLLVKRLRYRVGNGESISVLKDTWIPKAIMFKPICINRDMFDMKVVDLITPSGGWDLENLNKVVMKSDIADIIRSIPINRGAQ